MLCKDCGEYFYLMVIKSKNNKVCPRKPIAKIYLNEWVWTTLIIRYFSIDYQLVNIYSALNYAPKLVLKKLKYDD